MTKIITWWKRVSFWNKVRLYLTAIGIGSEATMFWLEMWEGWKWVAGIATLIVIGITHVIEDNNKNGIADIFEDDGKE